MLTPDTTYHSQRRMPKHASRLGEASLWVVMAVVAVVVALLTPIGHTLEHKLRWDVRVIAASVYSSEPSGHTLIGDLSDASTSSVGTLRRCNPINSARQAWRHIVGRIVSEMGDPLTNSLNQASLSGG